LQTKEWSELSGVSIEHDHEFGNWVRIINASDDDVPLNGFVLKQSSGGHCIQYKFHQRAKLAAKASVSVGWVSIFVFQKFKTGVFGFVQFY
jgi:hypothetical protein